MGNLSQSICLKHFQNILITPLGISKVGCEFNKNYTFTCKEVIWSLGSGMFEKVVREHVHALITAD